MEKVVPEISSVSLYRNHPIDLRCKSMGWFLCNGCTDLNWQRGRMVKENINL